MPHPLLRRPRFAAPLLAITLLIAPARAVATTADVPDLAAALDFLHFLASYPGNTLFSAANGWLPAIVGVPAPDFLTPFRPRERGYVEGFDLGLARVGANTRRVVDSGLHLLVGAQGSVEDWSAHLAAHLPRALRADLDNGNRIALRNVNRQDVTLAAFRAQLAAATDPALRQSLVEKIETLREAQSQRETMAGWTEVALAEAAAPR